MHFNLKAAALYGMLAVSAASPIINPNHSGASDKQSRALVPVAARWADNRDLTTTHEESKRILPFLAILLANAIRTAVQILPRVVPHIIREGAKKAAKEAVKKGIKKGVKKGAKEGKKKNDKKKDDKKKEKEPEETEEHTEYQWGEDIFQRDEELWGEDEIEKKLEKELKDEEIIRETEKMLDAGDFTDAEVDEAIRGLPEDDEEKLKDALEKLAEKKAKEMARQKIDQEIDELEAKDDLWYDDED